MKLDRPDQPRTSCRAASLGTPRLCTGTSSLRSRSSPDLPPPPLQTKSMLTVTEMYQHHLPVSSSGASTSPHRPSPPLISPPGLPPQNVTESTSLWHMTAFSFVSRCPSFRMVLVPQFPQFSLPHNACTLANRQAFTDPHVLASFRLGLRIRHQALAKTFP